MPILLTMAVPTLLLLAAAAARMPRRYRPAVGFVSVAIAGLGFLLTMVFVLTGADMAPLSLPLGPPAMAATVQLDRLAGFFLMLVFLCGTVALFVAAETGASVAQPAAVLAGLILTVVAADGVGPALGIPIVGLSVWAGGGADRRGLGLMLAAAACLFLAFTLGGAAPVEPSAGRTIAVALLTLAGCGILSGLLPAAVWLSPSAGALAVGVPSALTWKSIIPPCLIEILLP